MGNKIIIVDMEQKEINSMSNMVSISFDVFVGKDYSEEGKKSFKEYIEPKNILTRFNNKTSKFFVAKYNNEIIGALEITNNDHVSLLFIKKEFQGKGIGKKLFDEYLRTLKENIKIITVNSSFYAERIYSKLGFRKTNEMQEKDGIKFIPMEYKL